MQHALDWLNSVKLFWELPNSIRARDAKKERFGFFILHILKFPKEAWYLDELYVRVPGQTQTD